MASDSPLLNLTPRGRVLLVDYRGSSRVVTLHYGDPSKTAKHLEEELKKLGATPSEVSYAKALLAEFYSQISLVHETGVRNRAVSLIDGGKIVEQVYDPAKDEAGFVVYNMEAESVCKVESYTANGVEIKPLLNTFVKNRLVLLPTEAKDYSNEAELFGEVRDFFNRWHEEPRDYERAFDVAYAQLSWLYDPLPEIPYRRWIAPFGQGKTTALLTVGSACYKPMLLAGCDTEASLRRCFDLYRGTALIDEGDFNSALYSNILKILDIGWSNLGGWYVCQDVVDPSTTVTFRVFGPKLLATRERFKDFALESRTLTVKSIQNRNDMPLFRHERFLTEALEIRNKLLMFRFKNYKKILELARKLEEPGLFSELFPDAGGLSSRVRQLILPLGLLFPNLRPALLEAAKEYEATITALDEDRQREDELREAVRGLLNEVLFAVEKAVSSQLLSESGERGESRKRLLAAVKDVSIPYEGRGRTHADDKCFYLPLKELTLRAAGLDAASTQISNELRSWAARYARVARDRLDLNVRAGAAGYRYVLIPFRRANEFLEDEEKRKWLEDLAG